MFTGTYKIADTVITIHSLHEDVQNLCSQYRARGVPELEVTITPENIRFEQAKSAHENLQDGRPVIVYPDAYLESLAVYRQICNFMINRNTLLFHGSAIAVDGEAYLFTAASGTGKSTHTRLWRQLFGSRAVMVNDDKPLLKISEQGVLVCGTPWNGKQHSLGTNTIVPLKAICILERGENNEIRRLSVKEALPMLLQQSYRGAGPQSYLKLMNMLDMLSATTALYRLRCNMDPEAARVSYNGMSGKEPI